MSIRTAAAWARPSSILYNKLAASVRHGAIVTALALGGVLTVLWSAGLCLLAVSAIISIF